VTKIEITHTKNIRSWCRLIIPSMIGVAGSWKLTCQFSGASHLKVFGFVSDSVKRQILYKNLFST
jgi:hypothetical protein